MGDYKYCAVCKDGYWGFVDTSTFSGKIVVPLVYRKVRDFHYGLAAVYKDLYWHFINNRGDMQSERYAECRDFQSNGLAVVKKRKETKEAYLINKRDEIVYYCEEDGKGNLKNIRRKK